MSAAELEAEAREWLAGTPWTPKPGPVFLEAHDSHYRDFREEVRMSFDCLLQALIVLEGTAEF
jgi:hypothetical protein